MQELDDYLSRGDLGAPDPLAVIFAEDLVELDSTLRHHLDAGFRHILTITLETPEIAPQIAADVTVLRADIFEDGAVPAILNRLIKRAAGRWLYYGYNAEYLFFPFSESRNIREMIAFHSDERRDAVLSYVIDLYAADLSAHPHAVSRESAMFDRSGYYALSRPDSAHHNHPKERQLDIHGGLRWRFAELIPPERHRIDRVALFKAAPGLEMRPDFTFNVEEYNTYSCPWHRNITTAVASFRTAKALRRNPGSRFQIDQFRGPNSIPFEWRARQLLDLGMMETGQWF